MHRIFSISAVMMLLWSAAMPAGMSAMMMPNAEPMACHRPALGTGAAAHCHDMAGMTQNGVMEADSADEAFLRAGAEQKCPMDCCTLMGTAHQAILSAQQSLPLPAVMERGVSAASVVFSRTGFSSHTDRGPPIA
jgi:hypothetical protein